MLIIRLILYHAYGTPLQARERYLFLLVHANGEQCVLSAKYISIVVEKFKKSIFFIIQALRNISSKEGLVVYEE